MNSKAWKSSLSSISSFSMSGKTTIEKAVLKRAALSETTNAYRIVHRDECGAYSIDRYGDWLLVTGFDETLSSAALHKRIGGQLRQIPCRGGIVRTNRRDPHKRQLFCDLVPFGEPAPDNFLITERGLQYEISLNDSQHPGLFLDQRESRARVAAVADKKRVANLFSFTCSFSVAAAQAGADLVFSVDLAGGCLDRGKRNFEANGLTESGCGKFIKEDVRKWLARQLRRKEADPANFPFWDIIVCDPPVFAAAPKKGSAFSVEKEWPFLAESIRSILAPGGCALFANNHRGGDDGYYYSTLRSQFDTVTALPPPVDFPEGDATHVRTYWCV